jgi:hypothetical protein
MPQSKKSRISAAAKEIAMSLKPVCVACAKFYRPHRNGIAFIEMVDGNSYKLWYGDLWQCHGCGHEIIAGSGARPVSEHWMPMFEDVCRKMEASHNDGQPLLRVSD